mmetsp:Transcript_103687/g.297888  ORF Transcript_103687/g.297888 Transcript_103687/m.297888 type:complete len:230 (+) Transcript_103687:2396-3085(+)
MARRRLRRRTAPRRHKLCGRCGHRHPLRRRYHRYRPRHRRSPRRCPHYSPRRALRLALRRSHRPRRPRRPSAPRRALGRRGRAGPPSHRSRRPTRTRAPRYSTPRRSTPRCSTPPPWRGSIRAVRSVGRSDSNLWLLHDPAPALCMAPVEATVGNMAAVNGRGSAVWDGAQWTARLATLRARWAAADEAFHAMVRATARAQAYTAGHHASSVCGRPSRRHAARGRRRAD